MKLRWLIVERDHGKFRPEWPKTMSFGKPWQQFVRDRPVLQYEEGGEWKPVPVHVEKISDKKESP